MEAATSWSACWPICFSCDSETSEICLRPVAGLVAQLEKATHAASAAAATALRRPRAKSAVIYGIEKG